MYRFQRYLFCGVVLQQLLKASTMGCIKCYVENIDVHSRSTVEHIEHIKHELDMLVACSFKAHPENSLFMTDIVELRGPAILEESMCVMGKLCYSGCFSEHFSSMAEPIQRLTKRGPYSTLVLSDAPPWTSRNKNCVTVDHGTYMM